MAVMTVRHLKNILKKYSNTDLIFLKDKFSPVNTPLQESDLEFLKPVPSYVNTKETSRNPWKELNVGIIFMKLLGVVK